MLILSFETFKNIKTLWTDHIHGRSESNHWGNASTLPVSWKANYGLSQKAASTGMLQSVLWYHWVNCDSLKVKQIKICGQIGNRGINDGWAGRVGNCPPKFVGIVIMQRRQLWGRAASRITTCPLDAATLSGILKAKQKLGRTFNSDKLGGIAFTKISKLTMCSA